MNTKIKIIILVSSFTAGIIFTSCNNSAKKQGEKIKTEKADKHDEATEGMAVLTPIQRKAIHLKVGELPLREMSGLVKVTGKLEVAPNSKAEVTTYIGGNVVSINAFQGDKVRKGQVLATLEHPDIIQLQQDFIERYNNLQYLEKEYKRQEELYRNNVGSGKKFQKVEAEYKSAKAQYQGLKLRLKMLKLDIKNIERGNIIHQLKVLSPINGYVSGINISLGSYIDARTKMFSIRNFDKIHADLSVYEKDIVKIKKGQTVRLRVANMPEKELFGKIFAIAKEYAANSRSIVVHAGINNPPKALIADSYVSGEILTDKEKVSAVPETAIVNDGGKNYIFVFDHKGSEAANHDKGEDKAEEHKDGDVHKIKEYEELKDKKIAYRMVEVIVGIGSDGYKAITPAEKLSNDAVVVLDGAYYLLSDLKKSEAAHQH